MMAERIPVEIRMDPYKTGRGKCIIGGLDISRAVRSARVFTSVDDVTHVNLCLIATPIHFAAEDAVVTLADGRAERPMNDRLLLLLRAIHEELSGEAPEETKDA
jgi:hypothetical protein